MKAIKRTILKRGKKKPEEAIKKKALVKKTKTGQTLKSKAEQKLRVLILEDNPADAELMDRQLRKAGIGIIARRADTRSGFLHGLKAFKPDLVLADYKLPKFDALQALDLRNKTAPFTPFIIVTGTISEEIAVECMKHGADDYLLKDRLARLAEAVKHALETRRLREEKTRMEAMLQTNEQLYRSLIDSTTDLAFLKDDKFRHLLANQALCRFYGKAENEIIGKTDFELMRKNAAAKCRLSDTQVLADKGIHVSKETVGGLTFETRKFPVRLADGRIGVGGYIRDITERRRNEEALLEAAARWRTTFDSMSDAVFLLNEKGAVRQCNRAMNRLLDIPYTKIIGKDCLSLVCGVRAKSTCSFHLLLKDGKRHEEETFWRQRWFQVTADPIVGDNGRVLGAVHIMADITEAKKAKEALRESEERFRGLYENANIGMYRTTPDGRILMANPALIRMLGYGSFAELAERNLQKEGFEPDYPRREFHRQIERIGSVTGLEANWLKKDGTSIFVRESARVVKDAEGTIVFYDGTVEDISGRKHAEESLREMSEVFRLFLKHSPIHVFIKDENIRPVYLSENYEKMLKRPLVELLGKSMDELFPSALSRSIVEDDKRIMREGQAREFIEELEGRVYSTLKFPIFIQGKAKYLAGYTTDITESRQSQELLQATSRRLELALKSAKAGTWEWNVATGLIEWSPSMFVLFGLDPQTESASFDSWRKALHPQDRELAESRIDQALKQHATLNSDYRVILPGDQIRWINAVGIGVYDDAGRPVQMIGICQDISARKRTEIALRESEERYRDLIENSQDLIFTHDLDGKLLSANKAAAQFTGYPIHDLLRMSIADLLIPEVRHLFNAYLTEIRTTGRAAGRMRIRTAGGEKRYWEYDNTLRTEDVTVPLVRGRARDITEREQIEAELKESENRYRKHFENSSEFYFTLDLKGNFVDVNKAAVSLTGHAKSELLKMNFMDYTPKKDHRKLFLALAKVYKTGEPIQNFLIEAIMKDKSIKFFETNFSLLKDGEQIIGVQGSSKDITERKRDEEQIHASLREKEVLLKEIHHRVKNNLQVVSGLLTLQAQQIDDERLQHIIKDSQNRIWTMALIHQTLYQSGNLADIDMADYIRGLTGNLLSSHARVAMPPTVLFDLLPLRLTIDKAIPLALVLNELVTNVMKHAFADGRPGEIRISLHECRGTARRAPADHDSPPAYQLIIADNGVGLPEGFDLKSQKSLGLQLVAMLSKQLDAALAFESAGGTIVTITFHCHEKS